jgi:hypothetical protein
MGFSFLCLGESIGPVASLGERASCGAQGILMAQVLDTCQEGPPQVSDNYKVDDREAL